jgi:dihydrofolate reductase
MASASGLMRAAERKLIYDVAVSLDGFIAGPGGDISLFVPEGDHVAAYLERLKTYSTVVMGRRTYEFGYAFGLEPGKRAYAHMDHHVISKTLALPEEREVEIVREDGAAFVAALKRAEGGDIYLCGGGELAGALHEAGLIDVLRLKLNPIVLGEGVRLFGRADATARYRLAGVQTYQSGVAFLEYVRAEA